MIHFVEGGNFLISVLFDPCYPFFGRQDLCLLGEDPFHQELMCLSFAIHTKIIQNDEPVVQIGSLADGGQDHSA